MQMILRFKIKRFVMKKFIFLLCFIPLGCSVESSAVQDTPTVIENKPTVIERSIDKNCNSKPFLETYENFVELGIKSANLTTGKANITFSKRKTPEIEIKNNLTSEFGSAFLKDACALDGIVISIRDVREGYLGAYQITFNSEKNASEATKFLKNLDTEQLNFFKVATIFDWKLNDTTILITYNDPGVTKYYEQNVSEFSK